MQDGVEVKAPKRTKMPPGVSQRSSRGWPNAPRGRVTLQAMNTNFDEQDARINAVIDGEQDPMRGSEWWLKHLSVALRLPCTLSEAKISDGRSRTFWVSVIQQNMRSCANANHRTWMFSGSNDSSRTLRIASGQCAVTT